MGRACITRAVKRNRARASVETTKAHEATKAEACPVCGAAPGDPCVDSLGRKMKKTHKGRA